MIVPTFYSRDFTVSAVYTVGMYAIYFTQSAQGFKEGFLVIFQHPSFLEATILEREDHRCQRNE